MTSTTMTKARKAKKRPPPIRRRSAISGIEYTVEGKLTPKGYTDLDEAAHQRKLTDAEIDAMCGFEIEAAHDLLHYANVRGGGIKHAGFYSLGDVHTTWRAAETKLSNVAAVRDVWNSNSDDHCCLYCLCHDFLCQVLDGVLIDHDGGVILYPVYKA